MTEPAPWAAAAATDDLVEQTDNSGEEGQPDPPQDPDWRPWSDLPASS